MSWEAFRLTSKSPSELIEIMSPNGVDHLIREMLMACWRYLPPEQRNLASFRKHADDVFHRNMRVWRTIKKPSPEKFFENLLPHEEDGNLRKALVLAWMMLPRAGGRVFADVAKIVSAIYQRNLESWESDNRTFTGTKPKRTTNATKSAKKNTAKKAVTKKVKKKR
jgi:hypothetical protein